MDVYWRKKKDFEYMWCKGRLYVTFIIMSEMNSECSHLWEYAQISVKMSNFVCRISYITCFWRVKLCLFVCMKQKLIDL